MAQTRTVYSGLAQDGGVQGDLFADLRIWVAVRVPMRSTYVENIRVNGGTIVKLEKDADVLIADHLRPDSPPNSFSYTWIEACLKDGTLVDKERHRAGSAAAAPRPVGALKPTKTGRAAYTPEDDRELYTWVKEHERRGGKLLGNEIYKQLEEKNPRHPWQSWRDRYVKYISKRPNSDFSQATPPTPPSEEGTDQPANSAAMSRHLPASVGQQSHPTLSEEQPQEQIEAPKQVFTKEKDRTHASQHPNTAEPASISGEGSDAVQHMAASSPHPFRKSLTPVQGQRSRQSNVEPIPRSDLEVSKDIHDLLYSKVPTIQAIPVGEYNETWDQLAYIRQEHTAEAWREYYETVVLPEWEDDEKEKRALQQRPSSSSSASEHFDDALDFPIAAVQPAPGQSERSCSIAKSVSSTSGTVPTSMRTNDTATATTSNIFRSPRVVIDRPTRPNPDMELHSSPPISKQAQTSSGGLKRKAGSQSGSIARKRQHYEEEPPTTIVDSHMGLSSGKHSSQPVQKPLNKLTLSDLVDFEGDGEDEDEEEGEGDVSDGYDDSGQGTHHPNFEVYESHELPEGEKENFNGTGTPARHNHVKSDGALEVFTDPPSGGFMLQEPETPADQSSEHGRSWINIDDVEEGNGDQNEMVRPLDDAEAGVHGDVLDELRSEYDSRHQDEASEGDISQDWEAANMNLDTQAILNAETQVPDFSMPLPPDESQDEDEDEDEQPMHRHNEVPHMSQEDEDDLFVRDERPIAQSGGGETGWEAYDAHGEDDYDYDAASKDLDLPPPLDLDEEAAYHEDIAGTVDRTWEEEQDSGIPQSSQEHQPRLRAQGRNVAASSYNGDIKLISSSPRPAPPSNQSLANALASPHPSVSTIRLRPKAVLEPQPQEPISVPPSSPPAPIPSRSSAVPSLARWSPPAEPDTETLLTTFIAAQTARGHPQSRIIYALQRANLDGKLAERVLHSIERDGVVPDGVRGIWTEEDDRVMQGSDAGGMKRLEEKHGQMSYGQRLEFAELWGLL